MGMCEGWKVDLVTDVPVILTDSYSAPFRRNYEPVLSLNRLNGSGYIC